MTLVRLAVAAVAVQLGDALTWAALPAGAERNPVVAAADPWQACGLKAALVVLVLAVAWIVRQRPAIAETVLLAAVIAGALGTGSNLAASTSRSAPEPAPLGEGPSGIEQDVDETSVTPERSAAPSSAGTATPRPVLVSPPPAARDDDVVPRHVRAPAISTPAPTARPALAARRRGAASWYCCTRGFDRGDLVAAAGPALRVGRWRGRVVVACAGTSCVRVRLVDWCGCPGGRVIDLHPAAFARLAPLSRGLVDVVVRW